MELLLTNTALTTKISFTTVRKAKKEKKILACTTLRKVKMGKLLRICHLESDKIEGENSAISKPLREWHKQ